MIKRILNKAAKKQNPMMSDTLKLPKHIKGMATKHDNSLKAEIKRLKRAHKNQAVAI